MSKAEWPDWDAFLELSTHPGYLEIAHLREEALNNSLLIRCRKNGAPLPD